jgi:hypothetical protein
MLMSTKLYQALMAQLPTVLTTKAYCSFNWRTVKYEVLNLLFGKLYTIIKGAFLRLFSCALRLSALPSALLYGVR